MDTFNLRSIVFRSTDYGDTSKIINAFTLEKGLVSVMARGVKSPKSKKQNLIMAFSESNLEVNLSKEFYYLKDGEIISNHPKIRENLAKLYITQLFFDIIENTMLKDEIQENEFLLLSKSMKYLDKDILDNNYTLRVANMFLIKYISMIGYKPNVFVCSKCSTNKFNQVYFSNEQGGVVCGEHSNFNDTKLSIAEYKYLCSCFAYVFEDIEKIDTEIDEKKMFKLILNFIIYTTEIKIPKSLNMINKLFGFN